MWIPEFIDIQLGLYDLILNTIENLRKVRKDNVTRNMVAARMSTLEKHWEKFTVNYDRLLAVKSKHNEEAYLMEDVYNECKDKHSSARAYMMDLLHEFLVRDPLRRISDTLAPVQPKRMFPALELPKFSSIYTKWPIFRDLFPTMVKNDNAHPSVQKLHFLKVSFDGWASTIDP